MSAKGSRKVVPKPDESSAPKGAQDSKEVAATVRIDGAIYEELKRAVKRDGKKFKAVWEEAISNWLAGRVGNEVDRATVVKELQSSIASVVHQRLMEDEGWILDLVVARERRSFDAGVMGARSFHYKEEKDALAKCLVEPYLLGPIAETLAQNESSQACLAIDSGSGNVPFFGRLSSALENKPNLAKRVTVLTNNVAGAGTYMRLARETRQGTIQHGVDGPFTCSLLPGKVNCDYAAVVGSDTVAALKQLKEEKKRAREKAGVTTRYVGLLAANWVQVRPAHEGNPYAIPLVADYEQIDIKRAICLLCDDVYLTVPAPKLFLDRTIDEINDGLRPVRPEYEYKPIFDIEKPEDRDLARKVRLVTTLRPETTDILYNHSRMLKAMYPSSKIGDAQKPATNEPGDADAYFFNDRAQSGKTPEEQVGIAFPHSEHIRTPEFMKRFFMIS